MARTKQIARRSTNVRTLKMKKVGPKVPKVAEVAEVPEVPNAGPEVPTEVKAKKKKKKAPKKVIVVDKARLKARAGWRICYMAVNGGYGRYYGDTGAKARNP